MLSLGMKLFIDIPIVVVGMALFLFAFLCVFVRTFFRPHSKEFYQQIAEMPLANGDSHE